jgi:hypothetical protein
MVYTHRGDILTKLGYSPQRRYFFFHRQDILLQMGYLLILLKTSTSHNNNASQTVHNTVDWIWNPLSSASQPGPSLPLLTPPPQRGMRQRRSLSCRRRRGSACYLLYRRAETLSEDTSQGSDRRPSPNVSENSHSWTATSPATAIGQPIHQRWRCLRKLMVLSFTTSSLRLQ